MTLYAPPHLAAIYNARQYYDKLDALDQANESPSNAPPPPPSGPLARARDNPSRGSGHYRGLASQAMAANRGRVTKQFVPAPHLTDTHGLTSLSPQVLIKRGNPSENVLDHAQVRSSSAEPSVNPGRGVSATGLRDVIRERKNFDRLILRVS